MNNKLISCIALLMVTFTCSMNAQSKQRKAITIHGREVAMDPSLNDLNDYVKMNGAGLFYLQFSDLADGKSLKRSGIEIEGYIAAHIWLAYINSAGNVSDNALQGWSAVSIDDKISTWLQRKIATAQHQPLTVLVAFTRGAIPDNIKQRPVFSDISVSAVQPWAQQHILEVTLPADKISSLATLPEVKYINPKFEDQALNDQCIAMTGAEGARAPAAVGGYGLLGDGVTVGVGDDTNPQTHIDLADGLVMFNPCIYSNHGCHTAGTISGNGIKDQRYTGFAPNATLVTQFYSGVFGYAPQLLQGYDMRITNNSYGAILGDCDYAGTYDQYSQYLDSQLTAYPELLHIFAAANDGRLDCAPYSSGYATVAGAYQPAKNVLTVGSVNEFYENLLSDFSSRGPVKDGRIKPEISAVGNEVKSTVFNNDYSFNHGTSMACPNVTGAAALLLERYRQLHSGQNPAGALLKILLMNGATDILNPGPDFQSGFGLMNLSHSITALNNNQYFTNTINAGQQQTFTFTVPANTAKAKVMLYWNDPPAQPEAAHTLINDLDLKVTGASGNTTLPLILNPDPAQVSQPAVQGSDHTNNVEQVTLNNPQAGNYTITVSGYDVPVANQQYYVSYDFQPAGVSIQYPFGSEALPAGDSTIIYWEASDDNNTFTVQYTTDNGISWNTISNNVPANIKELIWYIPADIASAQCKIKVLRNNTTQQSISNNFTVMQRPVITLADVAAQCPGSVKMNWSGVPGAEAYKAFLYQNGQMNVVADLPASATSYIFSGLDINTEQWVAVAPVTGGKTGMRSVALARTPNTGSCTGYDNGDLVITAINNPKSGRELTSVNLAVPKVLSVKVNNFTGSVSNHFRISYKINDDAWVSQDFNTAIAAASAANVSLNTVPMDLTTPGIYNITVALSNLAQNDAITVNDTLDTVIKNIANPPLDIDTGFEEGFENVSGLDATQNEFGITGADRWDFAQSKPKGRIRSFVTNTVTIAGDRSMSMDNAFNEKGTINQSSFNTLTGTFNLSHYSLDTAEIRCELDYRLHGIPKFLDTGNRVWIRGSDTGTWIQALVIDTANAGTVHHSGSISFNDWLNGTGQQLTTSAQIKIEQYDTSLICAEDYGNGLTIDNFKLYLVTNDVQLLSIDSLPPLSCALSNNVHLTIKARNGVLYDLQHIPVSYQLDGGAIITDTIPFIASKDTVDFTFQQAMDVSALGPHTLSVWTHLPGDSYPANDSIINYHINNQPVIDTYPYLENFESSDGHFYTGGTNNSWQYGAPNSININHAASGRKAWKTNLNGNYNDNENSYLYSPCFYIGGLAHPTLSFSMAYMIEPRATDQLYDNAYMEYSNDGITWQRLGAVGEGTNWYNDSANVWEGDASYWHVATIPLPVTADMIMFRFVLKSDPGTVYDGIGIDDIHVYDLTNPIEDAAKTIINNNIAANDSVDFISNGKISGHIANGGTALGSTELTNYSHTDFINTDSMQYFLPRNFTIKPEHSSGLSSRIRLYIRDKDMDTLRHDTSCPSCGVVREVYRLGITKYSNNNKEVENDSLSDNNGGTYTYIPYRDVTWVPYDKGYYAEANVNSFSEFWFNDGGLTHDMSLNQTPLTFTASHLGTRFAKLDWVSFIDTSVKKYEVQRSGDNSDFTTIAAVNALHQANEQAYGYVDTPVVNAPVVYYRLHYQSAIDTTEWYYSITRRLDWGTTPYISVYPNPVSNGTITLSWIKNSDAPLDWAIYNIAGQRLAKGRITDNTYAGSSSIAVGNLGISSGILVMKVVSGGDKWNFKIVYQR